MTRVEVLKKQTGIIRVSETTNNIIYIFIYQLFINLNYCKALLNILYSFSAIKIHYYHYICDSIVPWDRCNYLTRAFHNDP